MPSPQETEPMISSLRDRSDRCLLPIVDKGAFMTLEITTMQCPLPWHKCSDIFLCVWRECSGIRPLHSCRDIPLYYNSAGFSLHDMNAVISFNITRLQCDISFIPVQGFSSIPWTQCCPCTLLSYRDSNTRRKYTDIGYFSQLYKTTKTVKLF